jgi:hypothetical protein
MTDIRIGGVVREGLVADDGQIRVGGLAREALVAGVGLSGTVTARSAGRSNASVLFAGTILSGSIKSASQTRAARPSLSVSIGGRVKARSSIRASLPTMLQLRGRITTRSAAHLVGLDEHIEVLAGRIGATSSGSTFAVVAAVRTQQYGVTINAS